MLMWDLKVKCSSIISPRYLISRLGIRFTPFSFIFKLGSGLFLFLNTISSVLEEFREILFAISQWFNAFKSIFSLLARFLFLTRLGGI